MNAENRGKTDAARTVDETAPCCLSGGTVLQTADGPRPVEDLVGERPYLFACHPEDGHVNVVQADRVFVSDRDRPMVRVSFDDGSSLDCTPDHPVMLEGGSFEEAHRLTAGSPVRVLEEEMKSVSFTELHVRTIGETGYGKTSPSRALRELLGRAGAEDERAIIVDPVGRPGRVRAPREVAVVDGGFSLPPDPGQTASVFLSVGDDGAPVNEPPRIYGRAGSTTRRVLSVEDLPGRAKEVYDVSMPALHNFAAGEAGVFVHNRGPRTVPA